MVLYVSVCQRAAKLQTIRVFKATYFAILCSESLLIGSPAFNPGLQFCRPWAFRDLKNTFDKILHIMIDMQKLKGVLEVFRSFMVHQKTLFYIINWQKGGLDCFPLYNKEQ